MLQVAEHSPYRLQPLSLPSYVPSLNPLSSVTVTRHRWWIWEICFSPCAHLWKFVSDGFAHALEWAGYFVGLWLYSFCSSWLIALLQAPTALSSGKISPPCFWPCWETHAIPSEGLSSKLPLISPAECPQQHQVNPSCRGWHKLGCDD